MVAGPLPWRVRLPSGSRGHQPCLTREYTGRFPGNSLPQRRSLRAERTGRARVLLPDEFFVQLFDRFQGEEPGFLERYSFTVDESTPLDVEVAIEPEMLGKAERSCEYTNRELMCFYA